MHLEICDLDGSLDVHAATASMVRWQSIRVVSLRDLGSRLRLWSSSRTIEKARERFAEGGDYPDPTVTLVGSGDFHHLTPLLLERAREQVTVVHFDNHPDWTRFAPRWHCGSWVNEALRSPNVARVVTVGPCSDDLAWPGCKGGNLSALASGRLRLFPWSHAPSRVLGRIADGVSYRCAGGRLIWDNLSEMSPGRVARLILSQIETRAVWLTIDKDVLPTWEAASNWDQGLMPLASILELIEAIGRRHCIAGADICGEYATPHFSNVFKRWEAKRDQPDRVAPDTAALARNASINCQLLTAIERAAQPC